MNMMQTLEAIRHKLANERARWEVLHAQAQEEVGKAQKYRHSDDIRELLDLWGAEADEADADYNLSTIEDALDTLQELASTIEYLTSHKIIHE